MSSKQTYRPLDTFCKCSSLRTGAIFTGVISMIAAALTMIFIIFTKQPLHTIIVDISQPVLKIALIINLFMTIVISGLLVLGVLKERKFFLLIWIILGIMLVISWVVSVIYWGFYYLFNHQYLEAVVWFIIGIVFTAIYFYLWLVVYCYYLKLKEEAQRMPYYKPAYLR